MDPSDPAVVAMTAGVAAVAVRATAGWAAGGPNGAVTVAVDRVHPVHNHRAALDLVADPAAAPDPGMDIALPWVSSGR